MEKLTLEELDKQLMAARERALKIWPYTYDEHCREIEAEYRRRRLSLPEHRDALK